MSTQYPKSWKNCAVCAFWCGVRECDHWGERVTVESATTKGKCAIPSGGWKGQERHASSTCQCWQKWPVLR